MDPIAETDRLLATLQVRAWRDPEVEAFGADPRSDYAELFWLPVLGPSALWLLRHLARRLDACANRGGPILLEPSEVARALGLGDRTGAHSHFARTLERCVVFEMAARRGPGLLEVRTVLPLLARRHLARLSVAARAEHERLVHTPTDLGRVAAGPATPSVERRASPHPSDQKASRPSERAPATIEQLRSRCRQLALSLVDLGEDRPTTEWQLLRWRFHPALARESAAWAIAERSIGPAQCSVSASSVTTSASR